MGTSQKEKEEKEEEEVRVLETVRVLHAYTPSDPACLALARGDLIQVLAKDPSGYLHSFLLTHCTYLLTYRLPT
jgi:hypothetical protein